MGCRLAGRLLGCLLLTISLSCSIGHREKPLNPNLLFTVGASFLDEASAMALKGEIEFGDDTGTQSGGFEIYLAGSDSISFVIEGPLGADVFKMIVDSENAYLLSNKDEGWVVLNKSERAVIAEYGIDNISPFYTGLYLFPQFYIRSEFKRDEFSPLSFSYGPGNFKFGYTEESNKLFLSEPQTAITAEYSRCREMGDGYYPARIRIFEPDQDWEISMKINKIRINPQISERVWRRD